MSSSLNLSGSTAIVYISYGRAINLPASTDSERGRETRRPARRYPDLLGLAEWATTFEAADRGFADLTSPNVKRLEGMSGSRVSESEMFSGSTEFDSQNREMRMK